MRFMVIVKATKDSEAGLMPSTEALKEMGQFNEELVRAGKMLAGEGLHPSSQGKRVRYSGTERDLVDGPFAEAEQLVAGFWLWRCDSLDEALDWAQRAPFHEGEVEIRQVFEPKDFGAELTPELREQEKRLRAQSANLSTAKH